jgi:hypothetical protein
MVTVFFRRGSYYARVFTPADLRAILRREEFQRSLGTQSYREAKIKASVWSGRVAALFARLRMNKDATMTPQQIQALVTGPAP